MSDAADDPAPPFPSRRAALGAIALFGTTLLGAVPVSGRAWAATRPVKLVAFGDSLTAGLGLPAAEGFTARLEAALRAKGHAVTVVNAGVSGDTTDMGLARLDWSVPDDADAVIVELGANDALRGLSPTTAKANLDEIVGRLRAKKLPVLVAGMYAPRNLGESYVKAFDPLFPAIAEKHGALLYPFFLDGVAGDRTLNQPDGLHPNAAGVKVIVERILPSVEKLLGQVKAG